MADALKGGLATSAFPASPTTLATAMKATRWRPKPGRTPRVSWIPIKASETIAKYDFLNRTAVTAGYERVINPAGAVGVTLTGDVTDATAPLYMALGNVTSSASVDKLSKVAAYSLDDIQVLMRLYASTASDAEIQDINVGSWRYEASTLYEWGIYEPNTSSSGYFPVVDVGNQDDDDGVVRIMEGSSDSAIGDDFGLVWCEFEVSNLA